ncbi:MAG: hypothetical protein J1E02_07950, partial [Coprobacter sp.]|nr:hypothetical protein [Coprobacter sp.]
TCPENRTRETTKKCRDMSSGDRAVVTEKKKRTGDAGLFSPPDRKLFKKNYLCKTNVRKRHSSNYHLKP